MFKIIALITALSGQPIQILVSQTERANCPNIEALANTGSALQAAIDSEYGKQKYKVSNIKCVPAENIVAEAKKMIAESAR